jgi:putative flippase GtrA
MGSLPLTLRRNRPLQGAGRFVLFAMIGASGLVENQASVWLLVGSGMGYLAAAVAGTEIAPAWNFVWTERLVFHARSEGRWKRSAWFMIMNSAWLGLQVLVLYTLTEWAGLHLLDANLIAMIAPTAGRFLIADRAIWRNRQTSAVPYGRIELGLGNRDRA